MEAEEQEVDYDDKDVSHYSFKTLFFFFFFLNSQTNPHTELEQYRFAVSVLMITSLRLLYGCDFTVVDVVAVSAVSFIVQSSVGVLQNGLILGKEEWWEFFS